MENTDFIIKAISILQKELSLKEALVLFLQVLAWKNDTGEDKRSGFWSFYESTLTVESFNRVLGKLSRKQPDLYTGHYVKLSEETLILFFNAIKEIETISHKDWKDILLANSSNQFCIHNPPEVNQLILALIDPVKGESLYHPQPGNFEIDFFMAQEGVKVFCEGEGSGAIPRLLNFITGSEIEFREADPILAPVFKQTNHILKQFDYGYIQLAARSIPPRINQDFFGRFNISNTEKLRDIALIEHGLAQTSKKLIVLADIKFLASNVSFHKQFKEYLISEGLLESVIMLPGNIFSHTTKQFALLVLNKEVKSQDIFFINLSKAVRLERSRRKNVIAGMKDITCICRKREIGKGVSGVVPVGEVIENRYNISPLLYIRKKDKAGNKLSRMKTIPLDKVATILIPQGIPGIKVGEGLGFKEIATTDIPETGFIKGGKKVKWISEDTLYLDKARVQPLDILVSTRGKIGLVGIVPEKLKGKWIASQSFSIVRVDSGKYDPLVLYMFFKSSVAQEWFTGRNYGDRVKNIKLGDLKVFPVPVYSGKKLEGIREGFYRVIELENQIRDIRRDIEGIYEIL